MMLVKKLLIQQKQKQKKLLEYLKEVKDYMRKINMDKIEIFIKRLKKIGIEIELAGNLPWIYLQRINGKHVTEKFMAEHGFTLAFLSN